MKMIDFVFLSIEQHTIQNSSEIEGNRIKLIAKVVAQVQSSDRSVLFITHSLNLVFEYYVLTL
jgi:Fe-S cluster assembly ATPase SufC